GVPVAGGFVYTYAAGTTTPLVTYTDASGSTPNADPVVLDSGGFANIWLGANTYKIVLQDKHGVQIWSVDNVSNPGQIESACAGEPNCFEARWEWLRAASPAELQRRRGRINKP